MTTDTYIADKGAILITGTSSGIGRACALYLDRLGYRVFAGVRKHEDGQALQREASPKLTYLILDITDDEAITKAAQTVAAQVGDAGLVALINNAAIIVDGPVEIVPLARVRQQFAINVFGMVAMTQAFLPLLRQGKGRIITLSAITGKITFPFIGISAASKAALETICDTLRMELRPWHIPVSLVIPLEVKTGIMEKSKAAADQALKGVPEEKKQLYAAQTQAVQTNLANQKVAVTMTLVLDTLLHALTDSHPKTRYYVGQTGRLITSLTLLSDHLRDWIMLRIVGLKELHDPRPAAFYHAYNRKRV